MIEIDSEKFIKLVATKEKCGEFFKVVVRPVTLKGESCFQAEKFKGKQVFHQNIDEKTLGEFIANEIVPNFSQVVVHDEGISTTYFFAGGKCKRVSSANSLQKTQSENNKTKNYIISEGEKVPALVDLGVFTKDFKIVSSKYDKFRQINRFLELIDDCFKKSNKDEISILDFGCGKSYLTFIVYYYFVKIKGVKAKIIGYDLKEDVVESCNEIAKKYGYDDLEFVVADVSKDVLTSGKIDMIITLHACDTATDYALFYAINKNVEYVFSVPCCQHEINSTIKNGGDLDIFLKYGIVKERASALLTDAIRCEILEDNGYSVDLLEFVDLAHSPKNLMIRATKNKKPNAKNYEKIKNLAEKYGFNQKLFELLYNEK